MSNRELIIDLVNKLPADTPLEDIVRESNWSLESNKAWPRPRAAREFPPKRPGSC
jgi:hypothetical protein